MFILIQILIGILGISHVLKSQYDLIKLKKEIHKRHIEADKRINIKRLKRQGKLIVLKDNTL